MQSQTQQLGSINEEESDTNSAKLQQQSSVTTSSAQKSGKEGSKGHKPPFSGLKKLIDRDKDSKDKDKDKDDEGGKKKEKEKGEKELSKAASVIKSGLNDTKENMKKLIGKDKQSSKASLQQQQQQQPSSNAHDEPSAGNGDLKSSPLVLMKRSSDVLSDGGTTLEVSITNVSNNDGVNNNNGNGNATHGIMSPFDSFNSDSESETDHFTHHQLSTSSSASVNIMMDNNTKNLGNVQVSQV